MTRLVEEAPSGKDWLHEIKYDGYRMHARIDGDKIQLLTRTSPDWSPRYERTIEALRSLFPAAQKDEGFHQLMRRPAVSAWLESCPAMLPS